MAEVSLADLYRQYKQEDEITVLEPGTYTLEVIRASVRKGQKGDGIMPVFKVKEGPYAGKTAMCGQFTASENGRSIFFRQMAGFGITEQFWAQGATIQDAANALVGRVIKANVTQRDWQGQPRNNIAIGGITLVSSAPAGGVPGGAPAPVAAAPVVPQAPPAPPAEAPAPVPPTPPAPEAAAAVPPPPPPPVPGGTPPAF